jgi:hypothetical protein
MSATLGSITCSLSEADHSVNLGQRFKTAVKVTLTDVRPGRDAKVNFWVLEVERK